ncbi:right-handed parallel beta-helix repeat-containing protein [Mariniflexile sp. HMF6888]|uniref:right-handed parallel beta-helix repeat-containing protein n=1 Tax=Mariniflexile sp. HMF6888 TaxID=3373086 RepID=UPI0037B5C91D
MLKTKNIFMLLIVLLTILCSINDLFAHTKTDFDDLLVDIESKEIVQDTIFTLDPKRWGIVEGKVSDEIALKNKNILNSLLAHVKDLGFTTMEIGKMDAYFKVDLNSISRIKNAQASIQLPSNFHLKMGNNTFLRVQPNGQATYTLMTAYLADNIKITGGNLIGDRYEHDYSPIIDEAGVERNSHGWGHLLWIIGSHNIEIDNVNMSKASGDGLVFHSKDLRNTDGTLQSDNREVKNILVKNSTITDCRRNNISFLDGRDIIIDNCLITDAGKGTQLYDSNGAKVSSSAGTAPRYGIDLESIRTRNPDGSLNETALIENVIIKNSRFTGNEAGDIVVYTANDVLIENNYFDKWVASFASYNVTINKNIFESRDPLFFAISVETYLTDLGEELNHHYEVTNNTIRNYGVGLKAAGKDQLISNNNIIDCTTGILLISDLTNGTFTNNTITSSLDVSFGYKNLINCKNLNNVIISNEKINVLNRPVSFNKLLNESMLKNIQVTFKNCNFYTPNLNFDLLIKESKNIKFEENTSNTGYLINTSENIILLNNNIVK